MALAHPPEVTPRVVAAPLVVSGDPLSPPTRRVALFVSEGDDRIALERERGPWNARACTAVELSWVEGRLVEGEPVECDPARRLRGDLSCYTEPAPTGGDPLEGIDGL